MRRVIDFAIEAVFPDDFAVMTRVGVPDGRTPSDAVIGLLGEARDRAFSSARPRAVVQAIDAERFREIYAGDGRNAAGSPLDEILPRAQALALFVATIGSETEKQVAQLFRDGDAALAMMLDAYASEITNRTADRLALDFAAEIGGGARALPYSPGYCGWHVTGQRALFAAIVPADIGVSLNPSCLMTPVKSVSGVLIAGDAKTHRFRPRWAFCDECSGRDCGPRMASVR